VPRKSDRSGHANRAERQGILDEIRIRHQAIPMNIGFTLRRLPKMNPTKPMLLKAARREGSLRKSAAGAAWFPRS
jgi:hypothetical protein